MNSLRKYTLSFELTDTYYNKFLSWGKKLALDCTQKVDSKQGTYFTLLPENISDERLYQFSQGGIFPSLEKKEIEAFANFWPTPNIDSVLAKFISEYLKNNINPLAIFEDWIIEPSDPNIEIAGAQMSFFNDGVYYLLQNENTDLDVIEECIFAAGQGFHDLIILSKNIRKIESNLMENDFDEIYKNADYVIIRAYDGESYLFWEKTDHSKN